LKRDNADIIIRVVIALIQDKLPGYVEAKPFDIQVLTPMRKGLLGVERLNQIQQRYLNRPDPSKKEKEYGQGLFREGDKVMQVRNNYQLEWEVRGRYGIPVEKGVGVFNGDTGILNSINEFSESAEVGLRTDAARNIPSNSWRNWNLPTRSLYINPRDRSIPRW